MLNVSMEITGQSHKSNKLSDISHSTHIHRILTTFTTIVVFVTTQMYILAETTKVCHLLRLYKKQTLYYPTPLMHAVSVYPTDLYGRLQGRLKT